jgi:hypothetical protein
LCFAEKSGNFGEKCSMDITTRHHGLQPADLIDNYDIRRVCVGMCDPGAGDYHEDSLPGDIIGAEKG